MNNSIFDIVYKYSFSNKSDDTIDSIIIEFLKQYKPQYNRSYLGFDSSEREEAAKEKIVTYELLSLKKNKTSRDHLKLLRTSIEFLRDSETRNEKRWWYSEAIHHLKNVEAISQSI